MHRAYVWTFLVKASSKFMAPVAHDAGDVGVLRDAGAGKGKLIHIPVKALNPKPFEASARKPKSSRRKAHKPLVMKPRVRFIIKCVETLKPEPEILNPEPLNFKP